MEKVVDLFSFTRFRRLFYFVSPNETTFENIEDVPKYLNESMPWLILLILMETAYSKIKGKDYFQCSDAITNAHCGMLQQAISTSLCGFEFSVACWLYENYGLHILPWDSLWTWIIGFLLVDLSYYWFHRGAHEINFFWAFHQVHHSSEHYNLTTASRQSMFQQYVSILFHLPEAFILPPSAHLVHLTLNKVNQFWVHTQVIKSLGPLEHILVTPSHHRVHHGRNRYCIDKNYSGTFIIWDKIFGTFQAENPEEPIVFGLVHNVNTFDVLYCQFDYLKYIFLQKIPSMQNYVDKLKCVLCGPGWFPETPRLGNLSDIPEITYPVVRYNPLVSRFTHFYCLLHLTMIGFIYLTLVLERHIMTSYDCFIYIIMLLFFVQCGSSFLDKKSYAPRLELIRLTIVYFWFYKVVWPPHNIFRIYVKYIYGTSLWFWILQQIYENFMKFNVKFKNG